MSIAALQPPQQPILLDDDERWCIEHPESMRSEFIVRIAYCDQIDPPRMHSLSPTTDQFKHLIKDCEDDLCPDCVQIIREQIPDLDECTCKFCEYGITTICSACGDVLAGDPDETDPKKLSHSYCNDCLRVQKAMIRESDLL